MPSPQFYNKMITALFPRAERYLGEVGVEIEMEGEGFPAVRTYWEAKHEYSLRGEGREYVTRRPVKRSAVKNIVKYLNKKFIENNTMLDLSPRCSVHVHFNCQELKLIEVINWLVLYWLLEPIIMTQAGSHRQNNMFCRTLRQSDTVVNTLVQSLNRGSAYNLMNDYNTIRYSAANVAALTKFNTIEFRALQATTDPDTIQNWVNLLGRVKDASAQYKTPDIILRQFSGGRLDEFIRDSLGELSFIYNDLDTDTKADIQGQMWETMLLVQPLAYADDWDLQCVREPRFTVGDKNE